MMLELIILLLGIPTGFLISYLAKDELKAGRRWFALLAAVSLTAGITFYLTDYYANMLTSFFIFIVSFISFKIKGKQRL